MSVKLTFLTKKFRVSKILDPPEMVAERRDFYPFCQHVLINETKRVKNAPGSTLT